MTLNAYLSFDGNCREACQFYAQVLGGTIDSMQAFGETPACEHVPADQHDRIMHAKLSGDGWVLMASDATSLYPFEGFKGCALAIGLKDVAEAHRIFDALSEGGKAEMPLQEMFWGALFGSLTDQYGVPWLINCEKPA